MDKKKHLDRVETLGAFMRSQAIIDALNNPNDESKEFIDSQVIDIINEQQNAGLSAISDGEFRFKEWDKGFYFGFSGVEKHHIESGRVYQEDESQADVLKLSGRIEFNPEHEAIGYFRFLKEHVGEGHFPRVSMPSPALFFVSLIRDKRTYEQVYENVDIMADDIIIAYRKMIKALYAEGCRSVKFDDPTWGFIYDSTYLNRFIVGGTDLQVLFEKLMRLNQEILIDMPDDLQKIMHVCRHSHSATWTAVPDYSEFAAYAFNNPYADAFMIDCGLESDLSFLSGINPSADVALGLSDPWSPALVEPEEIMDCIKRASEYFPIEQLSISPRAGFCSLPENVNAFEPQDQWSKIAHLKTIAAQIWK